MSLYFTRCDACGDTWPVPPTFAIACPECGARKGNPCTTRRPSEHALSAGFANMHPWGHEAREKAAVALGLVRKCSAAVQKEEAQLEAFA